MVKGFSKPPPVNDPDKKYTTMELEAIERTRDGRKSEVVKKEVNGQEVVSLDSLATDEFVVSVPEVKPVEPPPTLKVRSEDGVLEKLAEIAFGPKPGTDNLERKEELTVEEYPTHMEEPTVFCPNCSWDVSKPKEYAATEEDKAEFLRAILGNHRFKKQVSFLGGKLHVTYRSLTVPEEQSILASVTAGASASGDLNRISWTAAYRKYEMILMLEEIDYNGTVTKYPLVDSPNYEDDSGFSLESAYEQITKEWGTMLHAILLRGCIAVSEIFGEMMARADQSDFWDGLPAEQH